MEKEEIVQTLQKFGLTEYESKAYVTLSLLGPAKALEVSKQASIPQSKIYLTLESLVEKQLVEVLEERPKRFRAIDPNSTIKSLMEAKKEEFVDLKQKAYLISKLLRSIEVDEDFVEGVWVQRAERYMEVLDRLAEMMRKARRYVYDVAREFPYSSKYRETLLGCKKRNVKICIMASRIDGENFKRAKWYIENGIRLKVFEAGLHPRITVIDGREVMIRIDGSGNGRIGFHSIWSREPSFVWMMDNYLKGLWERAREMNFRTISQNYE